MAEPLLLALADDAATLELVGGKGAALARLAREGFPVPAGFHITTASYRGFIALNGLQPALLGALAGDTDDEAGRRIGAMFAAGTVPAAVAEAIVAAYAGLGGDDPAVAVRSSATAEDLPGMSFAGQHESYLNVRGADAVLAATVRCWASPWSARAIGYRRQRGIAPEDVALAVVVQRLVPADAAGVAFTVNPVTGSPDEVVVNAAWGLGESIVSGQVNADSFTVAAATGTVVRTGIGDKSVMTVAVEGGTEQRPVPPGIRREPSLTPEQLRRVVSLAQGIAASFGTPIDLEWALREGQVLVLQARPVTALPVRALSGSATPGPGARPPEYEVWNDSLGGDYLWTNGNFGEAMPDVMTPYSWSVMQVFMSEAMASSSLPGHTAYGNIGGRAYMNLSLAASMARAVGVGPARFARLTRDVFGRLPEGVTIPPVPLSRGRIIAQLLPVVVRVLRQVRKGAARLPEFLRTAAARTVDLRARIQRVSRPEELAALWASDVEPLFREYSGMLSVAARSGGSALVTARNELRKLADGADIEAMFTRLGNGGDELASLGPVRGVALVAKGELSVEGFGLLYGHRSEHELELSFPRPAEDPRWMDRQLALLADAPDVEGLLARQRAASDAAWARFTAQHPGRVKRARGLLARWSAAARSREQARSEVVRAFWVVRAFAVRAGELTGLGGDVFFLTLEEILDALAGASPPAELIAKRRRTYERYARLPAYPSVIRGRFDPARWAADPDRRTDYFDADRASPPASGLVRGAPGSDGIVEGIARVIASPDEAGALGEGDILVTTVTNIGWTPIFPRAAAVVTDVGAPLSHAAIVARELGIPAVVGCGNATMLIHSGDRIRVDGGQGTVEILPG